jgi:hypothetical protein
MHIAFIRQIYVYLKVSGHSEHKLCCNMVYGVLLNETSVTGDEALVSDLLIGWGRPLCSDNMARLFTVTVARLNLANSRR